MAELATYSASITPVPQEAAPAEQAQPTTQETPVETPIVNEQALGPEPTQEINETAFSIDLGDAPTEQQPTADQQPQFDWQTEIKKLNRDEVAAAIGIDPFAYEMDKHIKGGGAPVDYLQARSIDYDKFTDEGLVREQMRVKNPNLTSAQIDLLFRKQYGVSEDAEEDDKLFAQTMLQNAAYEIRLAKKTEQQKFKIADAPVPQKDEAYEAWKQLRQTQAQDLEISKAYYEQHPSFKDLNQNKKVAINLGEGVAPFNFKIEKPEIINRVLLDDGSAWNRLTSTSQGEPDVAKQQLLALIAFNPDKFCQEIYKYGFQMGERNRLTEGQNAHKPTGGVLATMSPDQKATYRTSTYGKGG